MQKQTVRWLTARFARFGAAAALLCAAVGCPPRPPAGSAPNGQGKPTAVMKVIDLADTSGAPALEQTVALSAARNEWVSFTLEIGLPLPEGYWLQLHAPRSQANLIPIGAFDAYQVLPMPVDTDRAAYVRQTGEAAGRRTLPRALLPEPMDGQGIVNLKSLRNPSLPTDPRSRAGGPGARPVTLWFDLHVPKGLASGQYSGTVDLMTAGVSGPLVSLPLRVNVYDFDMPDERHLQMVGRLGWDRLEKLYPEQFEAVTPAWVNRRESRYQPTVRTLDHLMALTQQNRVDLVAPALKPIVKWPAGEGPQIDWRDFDSVVRPWFEGTAFGDGIGVRYWPMPQAEMLDRYDRPSQLDYFRAAAAHFAQNKWLDITAVSLPQAGLERSTPIENAELCARAAELLACNPGLRVLAPLEDDQIELASKEAPAGIDPASVSRVLAASPALVSTPMGRPWPPGVIRPKHWLRTQTPGLMFNDGAGGDQRDVQTWAWLAFLRHVTPNAAYDNIWERNYVFWNATLPATAAADVPADPNETTWFYPGRWFGVDMPVATVQLKWLRRAEQDYEYLLMAQDRGEVLNAVQMARLLAKPVELRPDQPADAVYTLMTGTTSRRAWAEAHDLLADTILLRKPGQKADPDRQQELYIRTLQWAAPQERPLLMAREAQWSVPVDASNARDRGNWVNLRLGLDIYNASETTPDQNRLGWAKVPAGWEIHPTEMTVPRLERYRVLQASLRQRFNLDRLGPAANEPMDLRFVNGFTQNASVLQVVLPVAASDRREGRLSIDGTLDDWSASDAIQDGPLVRMLDRPSVQRQHLQKAATPSKIYTCWARENFYLAFALGGLAPESQRAQNFVNYQQRRAWGEDLCEVLIQPVFANNKTGPVLHVVCKPAGGVWVERKPADRSSAGEDAWRNLEGAGVRYAATRPGGDWRGEVAIPWTTITGAGAESPLFLRFNFAQHYAATGQSATWAGPVDFGRDDSFMGLLYLRTPGRAGVDDVVRGER